MYHVVLRHDGKLIREPVGHNRKEAQRALDARRGEVARREYRIVEDIAFEEWADQWLASFTGKESSRRVYETTINPAKRVFGKEKIRDLRPTDVRRFLEYIRDAHEMRGKKVSAEGEDAPKRVLSRATEAKHLRQLGACLEAARIEGYASDNPVRRLPHSARPKVAKSRPAYFTDDELARVWPELAKRPAYLALCNVAVLTGLRFGELAALTWSDVDLLDHELHINKTYTEGIGLTPPKSGETRTVDLTPQAAQVFEAWNIASGGAAAKGLVFQREEGGYLKQDFVRKGVLYKALASAGIPRVGERGRKRDFHSFRHTFARIALEHGAAITWVQKQLGHSSITLTVDTYGAWARAAEKIQARRLDGAFVL